MSTANGLTLSEVLNILSREELRSAIGEEYSLNKDTYCKAIVGSYTLYMYSGKYEDAMLLVKNMRVFLNRVKSGMYGNTFNGLI